ncbi:MAG TPA: SigE family RNA polymerase sigma factor [Streptosporangiaceae bacterium]|nr:SigE family RNA polymerase sigma factor [Streptosporangiaceae bacterium]
MGADVVSLCGAGSTGVRRTGARTTGRLGSGAASVAVAQDGTAARDAVAAQDEVPVRDALPARDDAQPREADATAAVTALYQEHSLGLVRLAVIMLGDRHTAEDVVQEAFCGLYRAWDRLADSSKALSYVRSSVLNGCRSLLRRNRRLPAALLIPDAASAEADALVAEEHRVTLAALNRLPARQREVLVLRFYGDLPQQEIAEVMGVSLGTVKSTSARALANLGRILQEEQ